MKELIIEEAEKIADDLDIDIDTLTPRGMDELYTRAERQVVDTLADMRDGREER